MKKSERLERNREINNKIIELKEQGKSQNEIAEILHISATSVSLRVKAIRESGVQINEPKTESELMNDRIQELRKKGMGLSEIAAKLNSNVSTISYRIREMKKRGTDISKASIEELDSLDLQIEQLKRQGLSQVQIAKQLGLTSPSVSDRVSKLKRFGIEFPEDEIGKNSVDRKIIEMRKMGASNKDISLELGIGLVAVNKRVKRMKDAGVKVPESKTKNKDYTELDKTIINLHEQGVSAKEISERLKVGKGYASKRLRANGIRTRKSSPRPSRRKLKEIVGEEKLAQAIMNLQESKKATKEQLKVIADYYGVELNIVNKLVKYVEER
jgi:biotin operon repressor